MQLPIGRALLRACSAAQRSLSRSNQDEVRQFCIYVEVAGRTRLVAGQHQVGAKVVGQHVVGIVAAEKKQAAAQLLAQRMTGMVLPGLVAEGKEAGAPAMSASGGSRQCGESYQHSSATAHVS